MICLVRREGQKWRKREGRETEIGGGSAKRRQSHSPTSHLIYLSRRTSSLSVKVKPQFLVTIATNKHFSWSKILNTEYHFKSATFWLMFVIHTKEDKIILNLIKILVFCVLAQLMEYLVKSKVLFTSSLS